jgi:DDE superfamily endonuclease
MAEALVPCFAITMTYFPCTRPASDGTLAVAKRDTCRGKVPSPLRSSATNEQLLRRGRPNIRLRTAMSSARRLSSWRPTACVTTSSPLASASNARSSANGGNGSSTNASPAWTKSHEAGAQPAFPPSVVVEVKRLACESPRTAGVPLARWSLRELQREVVTRGVVGTISGTTVWRWLAADAIRPWRHRSWLFPRDPDFVAKAGPILDLYAGTWEGAPLAPEDCVLSADEKTSVQARRRRHAPVPPGPDRVAKIEHEYERMGAWAYLGAWDVRRAKLFGPCEPANGIAAFDRLVAQVMAEEPYRSARRVFWIVDNGSGHRGPTAVERLQRQWPNVIPVFTPIHASWLNQIEIYFSVVQRKVLTPGDFADLTTLKAALRGFQHRYETAARPFEWTFTRQDLAALLNRLALAEQGPAA